MRYKPVEGILIDVKNGTVRIEKVFELEIEDFYEMLDCRCIDIVNRRVGKDVFTFVVDDEGLLKDKAIPSAVDKDHNPMLVGNLFICKTARSHLKSLSEEDRKVIFDNLIFGGYMIDGKFRLLPAVSNVSYA